MVKRIAVFASGNGTNFSALQNAITQRPIPAEIVLLVCDQGDAPVIQRAQAVHIPVLQIDYRSFPTKAAAEQVILSALQKQRVVAIFLAGYMRIVGTTLLAAYPHRIVNLHPALLPSFPGRHGIADALAAHVKETGVTVHFIDAGIDTGQIIGQRKVVVHAEDSFESLAIRIHQVEHQFYPDVLAELIATQQI